jgi:DNA-binding MarR family transcriptional regulator
MDGEPQPHRTGAEGAMMSEADRDELSLDELVVRAARAVAGLRQRVTAEHGLTPAGLAVLTALERRNDPHRYFDAHDPHCDIPSHRDLAGELGITPGALTATVDTLEGSELVRRVRDVVDRRIVRLLITPRGSLRLVAASAAAGDTLRHRMPAPPAAEEAIVRRYLRAVLARAGEEPLPGNGPTDRP